MSDDVKAAAERYRQGESAYMIKGSDGLRFDHEKRNEDLCDLADAYLAAVAEIEEWKKSCRYRGEEVDAWRAAAEEMGVPQWDGCEYSAEKDWALRVFRAVREMRAALVESRP